MTEEGSGTTRTATLVTALAVLVGVLLLIQRTGIRRGPILAVAAGSTLGTAVLLERRDSPSTTAGITVLISVIAILWAASLGVAVFDSGVISTFLAGSGTGNLGQLVSPLLRHVGLSLGIGIATFGVMGTVQDSLGDGGVLGVWKLSVVTAMLTGIALGFLLTLRFNALRQLSLPALQMGVVRNVLLTPGSPTLGLLVTGIEFAIAAGMLRWALKSLPVVELTARARRDEVRSSLDTVYSICGKLIRGSVIGGVGGAILAVTGILDLLLGYVPPLQVFLTVLLYPGLRATLLGVAVVSGAVLLSTTLVQWLTGDTLELLQRVVPAMVGAGVTVVGAFLASGVVSRVIAFLPPGIRPQALEYVQAVSPMGIVLFGIELVMILLSIGLFAIVLTGAFGYIPARAAGGAIAAAGLILTVLVIGVFGDAPIIVFALVGLAIIAWDASEHGVTTRAELGPRAGRQIEVLHSVGSVAVAGIGVGIAWGARSKLVSALAVPGGTLLGTLALLCAALILLGVLRG